MGRVKAPARKLPSKAARRVKRRPKASSQQTHVNSPMTSNAQGIHGQHWQALPTEIVMFVADIIISHHRDTAALKTLSLVCDAWRKLCFPRLFRKITVQSSRVDELYKCALAHGSPLRRHAQELKLYCEDVDVNGIPTALLKLSRALPSIVNLNVVYIPGENMLLNSSESNGEHALSSLPSTHHHPCYLQTLAGAYATLVNLSSLILCNHVFARSSDLLRILGSLPSLKHAELLEVSIATPQYDEIPDLALFATRRLKPSMLDTVIIHDNAENMLALLYSWTWPHLVGPSMSKYSGLSHQESKVVYDICRTVLEPSNDGWAAFYLHQSLYPQTWVLTITTSAWIDLEFHITENPSLREMHAIAEPDAFGPWINWVTFRFELEHMSGSLHSSEDTFQNAEVHLQQLHSLAHVVIESSDTNSDAHSAIADHFVDTKERELLVTRSCQQSKEYATKAKQSGVPAPARSMQPCYPISPYWYHDTFRTYATPKADGLRISTHNEQKAHSKGSPLHVE